MDKVFKNRKIPELPVKRLGHLNKAEGKTVLSFIKDLRESLGENIISIRLFGSRVKGDFKKDSDIDLFILIRRRNSTTYDKIDELTANYWLEYDIPLSPVVYNLYEYRKNKGIGSFFFKKIEEEGILL